MERLPGGDAEAELIGARITRLAGGLLGCHVRRRPDDGTGLRDGHRVGEVDDLRRGRAVARQQLERELAAACEPEVRHPGGAAATDQHVVGLEVAMHEPRGVGGGEPAARIAQHAQHLERRAPFPLAPHPERLAVDELHRDEDLVLVKPDVIDRDDVLVRQHGHRARLAHEPVHRIRPRPGLLRRQLQHLECDEPVQVDVERLVDEPHGTAADEPLHAIATELSPDRHTACRCAARGLDLDGLARVGCHAAPHRGDEHLPAGLAAVEMVRHQLRIRGQQRALHERAQLVVIRARRRQRLAPRPARAGCRRR
ncbi:MAG: hypothetical protein M3680_30330, partial [Myxococcota bacterium]|nr:hypothetical protein [Myxococcota bacterium]